MIKFEKYIFKKKFYFIDPLSFPCSALLLDCDPIYSVIKNGELVAIDSGDFSKLSDTKEFNVLSDKLSRDNRDCKAIKLYFLEHRLLELFVKRRKLISRKDIDYSAIPLINKKFNTLIVTDKPLEKSKVLFTEDMY